MEAKATFVILLLVLCALEVETFRKHRNAHAPTHGTLVDRSEEAAAHNQEHGAGTQEEETTDQVHYAVMPQEPPTYQLDEWIDTEHAYIVSLDRLLQFLRMLDVMVDPDNTRVSWGGLGKESRIFKCFTCHERQLKAIKCGSAEPSHNLYIPSKKEVRDFLTTGDGMLGTIKDFRAAAADLLKGVQGMKDAFEAQNEKALNASVADMKSVLPGERAKLFRRYNKYAQGSAAFCTALKTESPKYPEQVRDCLLPASGTTGSSPVVNLYSLMMQPLQRVMRYRMLVESMDTVLEVPAMKDLLGHVKDFLGSVNAPIDM